MNAQGLEFEHFTLRDIRRSVRTQIEQFRQVRYVVAEALLAHGKRGVNKVYNRFDYLKRKRKRLNFGTSGFGISPRHRPPMSYHFAKGVITPTPRQSNHVAAPYNSGLQCKTEA